MTNKLTTFFAELKARNVRKTMAIYLSSALTTIGVIKLFIEVYKLSDTPFDTFFRILVTVLACGLASAFVFGWFHGKGGAQKVSRKEILLHSLIAAVALIISLNIDASPKHRALPSGTNTIAVLPFKNMSDSKEDEYFSDGITEDILTQLAKVSGLNVISRSSVMKYKNTDKNIRDISNELGATAILEGSVRRVGNRVRITGQLIYAKEDTHLWAETYDREMKDIFAIQSEIARTIANELKAKLSPDEAKLIETKPTNNLDAYSFYLRGRDYYYRYRKQDNEMAIEFFKKALALDPNYALAYAGLGDAYCQSVQKFDGTASWIDSAIAVGKKSLVLNPSLAEGHKTLGLAYGSKGHDQEAAEHYTIAAQLNPNFVDALLNLGGLHQKFGNLDQALRWLRKAVAIAPERIFVRINIAMVYQILVLDSAAFRWYNSAIALDPKQQITLVLMGWLHLSRGEIAQARALSDTILARTLDVNALLDYVAEIETFSGNFRKAAAYYDTLYAKGMEESRYQLAFALQKIGEHKRANKLLEMDLAGLLKEIEHTDEGQRILRAAYDYAMLGNIREANQWLKRAIAKGARDYRWLLADPRLENLRGDAEFQRIIADLKLKVDSMRQKVIEEGLVL